MKRTVLLAPLLPGFFVMGFGDIIGTVMNQVKAECVANANTISWLMPIFAYVSPTSAFAACSSSHLSS